jgi:hypothetical protein
VNLTLQQASALKSFASSHGRRWKAALRSCWEHGYYHGVPPEEAAILQGIRNQFGPSWLARTALDRIAACLKGGE